MWKYWIESEGSPRKTQWRLYCFTVVVRSISSTFYEQFLGAQIPKCKKDRLKQLFVLLGSACVKALRKHVDVIEPSSSQTSSTEESEEEEEKGIQFNVISTQ